MPNETAEAPGSNYVAAASASCWLCDSDGELCHVHEALEADRDAEPAPVVITLTEGNE
jgi:hypothetical protein